jgi:hypothetical protein
MTQSTNYQPGIDYPASALESFSVAGYEWIDNLAFARNPAEFVEDVESYLLIARRRFLGAGWRDDGAIGVMWVPPFALPERSQIAHSVGVIVWHVKQESDGTSWLLYPPGEWRW